jgi:hypothetical protein
MRNTVGLKEGWIIWRKRNENEEKKEGMREGGRVGGRKKGRKGKKERKQRRKRWGETKVGRDGADENLSSCMSGYTLGPMFRSALFNNVLMIMLIKI